MEKTITSSQRPLLTIRPGSGWSALDLKELIQFRDLLFVLAQRDIKLRYRQTALGPIWIFLQPLLAAGVFTFVFGKVANMKPPDGIPYFLFSFSGMMGWNLFAGVIAKVSNSLVGSAHLVAKVYFPRLILPLSTLYAVVLDAAVASLILVVLMVVYHWWPTAALLTFPIWTMLLLMLGMGVGLCTSALMVSYRDVGKVVDVMTGMLMWISPVAYAVSNVPAKLQFAYMINPVAGLLEAFRWSLLGKGSISWGHVAYATVTSIGMFVVGAYSFKRMERRFADVI